MLELLGLELPAALGAEEIPDDVLLDLAEDVAAADAKTLSLQGLLFEMLGRLRFLELGAFLGEGGVGGDAAGKRGGGAAWRVRGAGICA